MIPSLLKTLAHWRTGVRLYIGIAITLVTLETWWWADLSYGGSSLFAIRLEEIYAWLALGLLTLAVAIGPVYGTWPGLIGKKVMRDARRLIGVGAAWFASLHVGIAYISLFKAANPLSLPTKYQQSFSLGVAALLILLAMAFTSFDRAFHGLGVWWFRLHRFVYLAIVFSLFHAFIIGAHAAGWTALIALTAAAVLIFGLHAYLAFVRRERPTIWQVVALSGMFLLLLGVLNYGYSQKLGYNPIEGKQSEHQHE